jgi:hypothetical protein
MPALARDEAATTKAPPVTTADLLESMLDPVRWAEWPDPAYEAGAHALEGSLELEGPGAITRIWAEAPAGTLRVFLDGADAPAIDVPLADLLAPTGPVGAPLADGSVCLLPIPFATRCRVTLDADTLVHIETRRYAETAKVETLPPTWLAEQAALLRSINERLTTPRIDFLYRSRMPRSIEPGQRLDLFQMSSMGAIAEIRLRITADDPEGALRSCLIVCEFDGRQTVRCPLGDFFGSAPGVRSFPGMPAGVDPDGTLVSRWFMPFRDEARISLEHLGTEPLALRGTIGSTEHAWDDDSLYFHAEWRTQTFPLSRAGASYRIASLAGRGVWMGAALHVSNPVAHWWGADGPRLEVDGTSMPTASTEAAFGVRRSDFDTPAGPFHGRTRREGPGHFGHNSVHRFRVPDPVPFTGSVACDVDVSGASTGDPTYASTAWYYGRDVESDAPPIADATTLTVREMELPVWRRPGAIEAEEMNVAETSPACIPLPEVQGDGTPGSWSGMTHYLCKAFAPGQSMTFDLPVERTGRYDLILYMPTCADYGMVQCLIDGKPVGTPMDAWTKGEPEQPQPPRAFSVGVIELTAPMAKLTLQNAGPSPRSDGEGKEWALDCVELRPAE